MDGVIFDIKRFAIHDGPGLRTTVFFKGCPLSCWWCHNPESISSKIEEYTVEEKLSDEIFTSTRTIGKNISIADLMIEISKERVFMEEGGGGVTISGGEPLMQPEFAVALLKECKSSGIHTTVDTSGFAAASVVDKVIQYTDLFLYDVKLGNSLKHETYTGVNNKIIFDNLKRIINADVNVVVRIPVIPGVNTEDKEIEDMIDKLKPLKTANFQEIHLLPYHHIGSAKYSRFNQVERMAKTEEPDKATLVAIAQKFEKTGFKVTIQN